MKKQIVTLFIFSIVTLNSAANNKTVILSKLTNVYNNIIVEKDPIEFNSLFDTIIVYEQKLFDCLNTQEYLNPNSFLNYQLCRELVSKVPDRNSLIKNIAKYSYSLNFNTNYIFYQIYKNMAETSLSLDERKVLVFRMLHFFVSPYNLEISNKFKNDDFSDSSIILLSRIICRTYSDTEEGSIKNFLRKAIDNEKNAHYVVLKNFKDSVKAIQKRSDVDIKLNDIIFSYFQKEYDNILDSLDQISQSKYLSKYINKDLSKVILLLGNLNSGIVKSSLEKVNQNIDNLYCASEVKCATLALIKLGLIKFTPKISDKYSFDDADLVYILNSKEVIFYIGNLLKDMTITTDCGSYSWMYEEEYRSMKIPRAYKLLWIILKSEILKNLPYNFLSPGDQYSYCFFYKKALNDNNYKILLTNVSDWIISNENSYEINSDPVILYL